MEHIYLVNKRVILDIKLRGNTVLIRGETATGKSLIANTILKRATKARSMSPIEDTPYAVVEVFSYENYDFNDLKSLRNKVIIIDNADEIMKDDIDIVQFINGDSSNQYIIIGRGTNVVNKLEIMPNYVGHLETSKLGDKLKIELVYDYTEGTWW